MSEENVVYVLTKAKEEKAPSKLKEKMPRCPICGKKTFLSHDVVDGYDFGYSGGCVSFRLYDGVHGITDSDDPEAPRCRGYSSKEVSDKWIAYCRRHEK